MSILTNRCPQCVDDYSYTIEDALLRVGRYVHDNTCEDCPLHGVAYKRLEIQPGMKMSTATQ